MSRFIASGCAWRQGQEHCLFSC